MRPRFEIQYFELSYMYRDVQKVFGHYNFLLNISYKTTIFKNIISQFLFDFDDIFTDRSEDACSVLRLF
jgi:hypothetical protein